MNISIRGWVAGSYITMRKIGDCQRLGTEVRDSGLALILILVKASGAGTPTLPGGLWGQISGLGWPLAMAIGLKRGGPRAGNLNKSFLSRKSAKPAEISAILVKKGEKCKKELSGKISNT